MVCFSPPPALPPKKRQSAPSPTRVAVVAPMSRATSGSSLPLGINRQVMQPIGKERQAGEASGSPGWFSSPWCWSQGKLCLGGGSAALGGLLSAGCGHVFPHGGGEAGAKGRGVSRGRAEPGLRPPLPTLERLQRPLSQKLPAKVGLSSGFPSCPVWCPPLRCAGSLPGLATGAQQ